MTYFFRDWSRREWWKLAVYLGGFGLLFVAPFVVFAPSKAIFVFVLVHVTSGVYLANCFAPNHKGMPNVSGGPKLSFLEQQVITARNVRGGFLTDLLLVGLNYQTEHHLFPYCPRNKLRLLQPYVRAVCEDRGIAYTEVGFIETNRILLGGLASVARAARRPEPQAQLAPAD